MIISLNRLENDTLDESIPHEVLLYTVYTCGKKTNITDVVKKREKVIKFIKNYKQHIVVENNKIKKNHLELIINYLTSEKEGWEEKNLLKSFSHICSWNNNKNKEMNNSENIKIGKKTNSCPLSYDIIMIYQLCKEKNIDLTIDDTLESMFSKLVHYEKKVSPVPEKKVSPVPEKKVSPVPEKKVSPVPEKKVSPVPDLKDFDRKGTLEYITENIHGCSDKTLYKIKDYIPLFKNFDFKHNIDSDIQEIVDKININYMIMKSFLTPIEAIIFGAKFFFIDLTKSTNPISELRRFNLCKHNNKKYHPVMDDEFSNMYNNNHFSIYLDKFWKPNISELYSNKILQQLNIFENTDDNQNIDMRYKMYNFYPGSIKDKESEEVITFGIIGTDSVKEFNPSELSELFSSDGDFINPLEKTLCIPLCVIGKLINICKEVPENDKFIYLLEVIKKIKSEQKIKDSSIDDIVEKYIFSSEKINNLIKKIFLLGLKSRGWKEKEVYITSFSDIVNENIIVGEITNEASYIMDSISNWQDVSVRVILKRLPIITYSRKCGRYYRTVFLENIYTIFDLLKYITTIDTEKKIIPISYILMSTANFYKHEVSNENIIDISNLS